jgi:hypothetical protein
LENRFRGRILLLLLSVSTALQFSSCSKEEPAITTETRSLQVWLHRVNSTSKARVYEFTYPGFELDVHYDTAAGTFIVKHDASDTSTLTLSAWLSAITEPGRLGFWLDFKNLAPFNKVPALAELLRIRRAFNLNVHPVVVESSDPSCLPGFDTLNFVVSYYIPMFDPSAITPEEELQYRDYIETRVSEYGIKTISGYNMQHEFMKQYFPGMNKLLWYLDSFNPAMQDSVIAEVKQDTTVQVLLVAVNVVRGNRE